MSPGANLSVRLILCLERNILITYVYGLAPARTTSTCVRAAVRDTFAMAVTSASGHSSVADIQVYSTLYLRVAS